MIECDDGDSSPDWDEVVDVICVGTSPGVLAYGICCVANDLDVMLVRAPAEPDELTLAWYAAMTEDLDAGQHGPTFSFARFSPPPPPPVGKRVRLETFFGERLRQWSAHCLKSPFGLMFTQVPGLLIPMRTDGGESVTAGLIGDLGDSDLNTWLAERARKDGLADPETRMAAMVPEEGRIAGVELDGGYLVAATGGLVLPTGADAPAPDLPGRDGCTVAVVGRPAGRFATVDLITR